MLALINVDARIPWAINTADLPVRRGFHMQRQVNVGAESASKMRDARINRDHTTKRRDQCSRFGPVGLGRQNIEHTPIAGELRAVWPDL
jgi:hypothetical protein